MASTVLLTSGLLQWQNWQDHYIASERRNNVQIVARKTPGTALMSVLCRTSSMARTGVQSVTTKLVVVVTMNLLQLTATEAAARGCAVSQFGLHKVCNIKCKGVQYNLALTYTVYLFLFFFSFYLGCMKHGHHGSSKWLNVPLEPSGASLLDWQENTAV